MNRKDFRPNDNSSSISEKDRAIIQRNKKEMKKKNFTQSEKESLSKFAQRDYSKEYDGKGGETGVYREGGIKYIVSSNRWRDKINGNTYYTTTITDADTGETVSTTPTQYGYGDQYRHTAKEELIKKGLLKKEDSTNHDLIRKKIYFEEQRDTKKRDL